MNPNYLTTSLNNHSQVNMQHSQLTSQEQTQPQAPAQPQPPQSENFYSPQSFISNNSSNNPMIGRSDTPDRASSVTIINSSPESALNGNRIGPNSNSNLNYHPMNRIPNIQSFTPYQFFPPTSQPIPPASPTQPINRSPSPSPLQQHLKKARFNRVQNFNAVNIRGTIPVNQSSKNYPQPIIPANAIPIMPASPKAVSMGTQVLPNTQALSMNLINSHSPSPNPSMIPNQFPITSRVIPFDNSNTSNSNGNKSMIINIGGIHNNISKPLIPQTIPLSSTPPPDSTTPTAATILQNVNTNYPINLTPMNLNLTKNVSINMPITIPPPTSTHRLPVPEIQIPKETETEIPSQSPYYFRDPESGDYGMHCVCGKSHTDGLLLQCEHCELWLHGMCVNIPRSQNDPYFCPFCLGQRIKCNCGMTMIYNIPLIRCSKCKFWFHKECQELYFGVVPKNFVCPKCNGGNRAFYDFPRVLFDDDYPNKKVLTDDIQKTKMLETIPEGNLKNEIIDDLNYSELDFKSTIEKYYQKFAVLLFDGPHEFWKVFVNSLCSLLSCEKGQLLDAIDHLTTKFLYTDKLVPMSNVKFGHSDSITEQLEQKNLTRFEKPPDDIEIFIDENDGKVKTPVSIDDGSFITDLPGFIMRTDDVNADKGIPKSCLVIANSEIVVDLNGTQMCKFATSIRRSFHFNAIAKLIRVKGEAIAALFATRMKGPLSEEKNRRGPAIPEGGEIILPFDGEIPYNVQKIEWKEKKARYNSNAASGRNKGQEFPSSAGLIKSNLGFSSVENSQDKTQDFQKFGANGDNRAQEFNDELLQGKNDDEYDENGQKLNDQDNNEKSWQKQKKERKRDKRKRKQKTRPTPQRQKSSYSNSNAKDKLNSNHIDSADMNLSLLSSFMSDVVPPMPFILLPDQNAVDKYKMLQMVKSHSRHS